MEDDLRIELSLSEQTAKWLYIEMGRRPHDEVASREVFYLLHRELYGESFVDLVAPERVG